MTSASGKEGSLTAATLRHRKNNSTDTPLRKGKETQIHKEEAVVKNTVAKEGFGSDANTKTRLSSFSSTASTSVVKNNRTPALSYSIAKWVILRLLGFIYLIAFLGAYNQNLGLMGDDGLIPASSHWQRVRAEYDSQWNGFLKHPSLFWWIPLNDSNLQLLYSVGILFSALVALAAVNSWLIQFSLWILYFTVVTTAEGTSFYAYGWESQLLETGFLAVFLCALPYVRHWRFYPCLWESTRVHDEDQLRPSYLILLLFRWLCFRISLGAGLIKIRGSSCWASRTCLHFHFETQPIPSPLSFFYHFLPRSFQSNMVDIDLWVQLYTSFFVLMPTLVPWQTTMTIGSRFIVRLGGFVQAGFMVGILLSGNFAFLNHLTIIPALACLDDACWTWFFKPRNQPSMGDVKRTILGRNILDFILLCYIGYLSSPVVSNLLQREGRQVMNASFDPFRLVNTYGAFGSVGEKRFEPIVSISDNGRTWTELEFPCKPGNTTRTPCFCAPYHYRADWNIWFLGFKPHQAYLQQRESWLFKLVAKILERDDKKRPWLKLLDRSSEELLTTKYYSRSRAPLLVKVDMYNYKMAAPLWEIAVTAWNTGSATWWNREFEEVLIAPVLMQDKRLVYARI